jgi:hypothetical protein
MMSTQFLQNSEVLPVGALLVVVVVCLVLMLLSKKPDPKMSLLLDLPRDLPPKVDREIPSTGKQGDVERRRLTGMEGSWGHFLAAYLEARFSVPTLWEVEGSFAPD